MADVVILVEPEDRFLWRYQMLPHLVRHWRQAGHRIVAHERSDALPAADLGFLNLDRSVVPPGYLEAARRFPRTVNGTVADIRKRTISTLLVRRGDGYEGPVIVKSDLNSGGHPELTRWKGAQHLGREPGPRPASFKGDYPVFASPALVPPATWSDDRLVVERFVPEPGPEGWRLRQYWFLGEAELNLVLHSPSTYVKGATTVRVEEAPVPAALRERRRALGFDYGKFDYVLRGGEPVLLDANKTPASDLLQKFGLFDAAIERLGAGLEPMLAR